MPKSNSVTPNIEPITLLRIQKDFYNSDAKERGKDIENTVAKSNSSDYLQIGDGYDGKFPVVDLANGNSVVSIKSLNQYCPSYKTDGKVDVNLVADQIMRYYNDIDNVNIFVNNRYTLEKELLVTLNGKNTEIKLQVQEEVNRRIEKKYSSGDEGASKNKQTKCKIV